MLVKELFIKVFNTYLIQKVNTCYMLDDDGREIQITTAMIRSVCHQLLKQCRTIKNKGLNSAPQFSTVL